MKLPNLFRLNAVQVAARHASRPSQRLPKSSIVALQSQSPSTSCSSYRSITSSAASRRAVSSSLNGFNSTLDDRDERPVRMIMFGKPAAGKGTLTSRLVKKYDLLSISTGDLLRQQIAQGTEVGKQAEEIMARGGLVPDELMLKIVTSKLDTLHNKHWILDGFPRTLRQGQLLESHLRTQNTPLTLVVNLNVPDEVILSRISDRWVHLPSGRVYNTAYNPPRVAGYDDVTGEPLTRRPDDNPEIFAQRLQAFYASTSPLLAYYEALASQTIPPPENPHLHPHQLSIHRPAKLTLRSLTGNTSDEIWPELDYIMMSMFPGLKKRSDLSTKKRDSRAEPVAATGLLAAAAALK
ncbi:adenylate kinase [Coprinopsis cinerea okayama7|uniref:Adenylate kinase n=1 Tax=Coprinopsis cinerea (strain Okayama-7 / 130 / ATCC MYA-4618 / FGSC 9003) TaxID=240176 RepID=A8NF79_COPC7|nr:adenylate kinase [Coprinopsis cinerea okayama7\|eukprot:XP_001833219.1 adenylate kinase [Coprinopsis cinerea okayama7\